MVPGNDIETQASKDMSHEDFLKEIEEYAQKLKKGKTCDEDTAESSIDDSNSELDTLYQEVEEIKEELEAEKEKVRNLKEPIRNKNKVIESLECQIKKEDVNKRQKITKCRYWNRGYCKEGKMCQYLHKEGTKENYTATTIKV